eukprot:TRINITY_DN5264_c0_g1_i1.p1 TRINITY_DN5264_c0_g1~~TRINITY_DN5264_c0_g1_i1.p1  ORF type:complete len:233 (+),score=47.84 TRINITY_DN5264_c0_g1_i1:144-842(+)
MAREGARLLAITLASQCVFFLVVQRAPHSFAGALRRSPRLGRTACGVDAPPAEQIVGAWRYIGGAYAIKESDGQLVFHENNLQGELRPEAGWLVADLPPAGTIRLRMNGDDVLSNFKPTNSEWGEDVTALREWKSLSDKTVALDQKLDSLSFMGKSLNGAVVVTVDGRQRPSGLKISDEAANSQQLGSLIVEAHNKAVQKSMTSMTERLREVYAAHFSAKREVVFGNAEQPA